MNLENVFAINDYSVLSLTGISLNEIMLYLLRAFRTAFY